MKGFFPEDVGLFSEDAGLFSEDLVLFSKDVGLFSESIGTHICRMEYSTFPCYAVFQFYASSQQYVRALFSNMEGLFSAIWKGSFQQYGRALFSNM